MARLSALPAQATVALTAQGLGGNDQIVQKTYGEEVDGKWRGCAVGCAVHSLNAKLGTNYKAGNHTACDKVLGIPEWLARLEDTLFEELPVAEAKK